MQICCSNIIQFNLALEEITIIRDNQMRNIRTSSKQIEDLTEQIRQLRIKTNRVERELRDLRSKQERTKVDRYGTEIVIGCQVRFLTTGKYDSTEGVVIRLKNTRVVTKDPQDRTIARAYHNVRILEEEDE